MFDLAVDLILAILGLGHHDCCFIISKQCYAELKLTADSHLQILEWLSTSTFHSRFKLDAPRLLWWPKQTMLGTHHPCFVLIFTRLKVVYTISFVSPKVSQKASSLYSIVSLDFSVSLLHLNRGIVEGYFLGSTGSQADSIFSCKETGWA